MTAPITTLLLDVDGTLLDTREFIFRAYETTLPSLGLPVPGRDALGREIGRPLADIYRDLAREHVDEAMERHRQFQKANLALVTAFPGVAETLDWLARHGVRMAAVTSRSRRTSVQSLEQAGLATYFRTIVSAEDAPALKPDPAPLRLALERLGPGGAPAAIAGDTRHDIEPGHALGLRTIGVTYGFGGEAIRDAAPDHVIERIEELPAALGFNAGP